MNYATSEQKYKAFKAKAQRRRLLKKEMEKRIESVTAKIIKGLADITGTEVPKEDANDEKAYRTLKDTFDVFDKDGSAELGYEEYVES